ncbi:uncharacterized protein LOC124325941 [Daphnia pulicaria]|uniref:uncharacterized protein LOC124325941 n=2 Tax=Daphnia pulicaria TaxID=35523 RepID=UPI001EE9CC07|nr:uncharacterized protein LOC124325941 [Daphnia pulicaria]XP_046640472.1 uncharacterized protein LOC124325941 [Daphnia pulicaria]XP_046640473.1 uncharacterized protein LOC124325941 [Daphnia pulicaria]XP_046640474.1 uncharacterized protein LOC124325941 [Daphnia pulicaria]XP_046640475.1 uncharacterized protein LOC124325941 [Daphnia pulicaria]XP_046640476.1 uncharacterized protein LOC124325941 [Daphnia pulicaria]
MDLFYLVSFSFWVFVWHLHQSSDAAAFYQECLVDGDCSDASYCDQSYLVCETCIPCESLLNRASGVRNCATSQEECGPCLSGYQSEDLTDQRRSYKCFPLLNEQAEVPSNSSSIISWNEFITLSSAIVVLAAVVVAFATYYLKSRGATPRQQFSEGIRERVSSKDDGPPSYSQALSSDETYTFITLEPSEQLNQATPLGRYHMSMREDDLDPDDLDFDRGMRSEGESTVGSTETIPSLWEPALTPDSDSVPVPSQPNNPGLTRSQSLTTLNALRDSPSRSCPNLFTAIQSGIHRHRHVFLSNYRRLPTNQGQVTKKEDELRLEFSEPLPPHSFTFDEAQQPREVSIVSRGRILLRSISAPEENAGSQDTLVVDPAAFTSFSRRRPLVSEDVTSNKRRRRE